MHWPWSSSTSSAPWYAAGLAFECSQCGRCCAGPNEGYVWVEDAEIAAIAESLALPVEEVRRRYVRRVNGRLCLIERPDNHDCIFLSADAGDGKPRGCQVYAVRPLQCRTWPFWAGNLDSPDDWARAATRCPGVNRGQKFTLQQIHERLHPPK